VTLIEASIMLMVTAILIAAMAPLGSRTLDTARLTRAQQDIDAIAAAINNMMVECCSAFDPFTTTGASGGATVQMLVGDGDTPRQIGLTGAAEWDDPVGTSPTVVDFLERHLVTNTPIGGGSYATGSPGWRGAYLNGPVDPDPWGNRYAVNVLYLRTAPTSNDVFVLSTGPDEEIDTEFTVNGAKPGDDDITSVIRRDLGDSFTVP
jgi:hypothetical protein